MKIRCLIVEDEPLAADVIENYVSQIPYLELVAKCEDAIEAAEWLQRTELDLLFLDINMPGIDGMTLAKSLDKGYKVIFTTAYPEYAVDGFNIDAIDYLMKPIRFERFEQAVQKAREKLRIISDGDDFIMVKVDRVNHKIVLNKIFFLEGFGDFVKIHLADKVLIGSGSLKFWSEKLPEKKFIRVHKSYVVNLGQIETLQGKEITTQAGMVPIGNAFKADLKAAL